uniref:Myb/SANT-like DNA-binding domain-containing protein n=1 Tax=Amphimedon queenslandica TaxID=400682 RepID=A0A1X7TTV7_AMPQE
MASNNYSNKDWKQCRTKIKGLVAKYRKMKDGNRVSGRDRKDCPFYDCFDFILGTRAATVPPVLIDSSQSAIIINTKDDVNTDDEVQNSCIAGGTVEHSSELLSVPGKNIEPGNAVLAAQPESASEVAEMHAPKKGHKKETEIRNGRYGRNVDVHRKKADEREEKLIKMYDEMKDERIKRGNIN